ncbi:MAG: hypothetical protein R3C11_24650 [Planctomycetaceae bacterium]
MARNQKWVLCWDQSVWQLYRLKGKQFVRVERDSDEEVDESIISRPEQIWTTWDKVGYRGEPVLIALGGNVCSGTNFRSECPNGKKPNSTFLFTRT